MYKLVVIINTCHIVIEDCSIASAWPTYCILQPHVCRWTVVVLTFFFFFSCGKHHQSPEWTILSHGYLLIQWEIVRPQVLLDSLHPRSSRTSWWSPPVLHRGSSDDTLAVASVSSGILAIWPNRERRRAWTIADRRGCPVVRLTSSFRTWWYHLIPNNFRKHHNRGRRSWVYLFWWLPSTQSHTGR